MSTITFTCPHCSHSVQLPADTLGKQGNCPGCKTMVQIVATPQQPLQQPVQQSPLQQPLQQSPLQQSPLQQPLQQHSQTQSNSGNRKKLVIAASAVGVVILLITVSLFFLLGGDESANNTDNTSVASNNTDNTSDTSNNTSTPNTDATDSSENKTITNTIGMTLKEIPTGTFMMGSPDTEKDRRSGEKIWGNEQQHKVTVSKAFYMQTTEVTQGQWKSVMGTEPWKRSPDDHYEEGPDYPAVFISWLEAVAYCKKLSEKEGKTYRLPTEAEWEYACRAGTKTTWNFGDDEKVLGDYAWYKENASDIVSEQYAHQVGLKKPNAFGLYDMHGNVMEMCLDKYGVDYYKQSPEKDPTGPARGAGRIKRGGSWYDGSPNLRSAFRLGGGGVEDFSVGRGFRLVRELD